MDNWSEEKYLSERVDGQIDWFSKESSKNQKYYKRLRILEIVMAGLITLFAGHIESSNPFFKWFIGILGLAITLVAGILSLYKFQENWIEYRSTAETLKQEKYFFVTRTAPYDGTLRLSEFVNRIEQVISKENANWVNSSNQKSKEK